MTKLESLKEDFNRAIGRLEEVLQLEKTDIIRDSAIKRFEITFELAWKTVKAYLETEHSSTCVSPRTCFQEAFRVGLIDYDEQWLRLIDDRNYTAHTYKEVLAEKVYADLPNALQAFQTLQRALEHTT
ncbi:MAG: nucleotidyltransferase substrate binding protein [Parcubacteria group bacterium Gr01-1014_29]|nr:MAG: nucleotidyltransferase substrate binding protein [Parcubacteria group bacterium Gr01-1014_29]